MKFLLDELEAQQHGAPSVYTLSALQRAYGCRCKRAVFFLNSQCLSCRTPLGYEPELGQIFAIEPTSEAGLVRIVYENQREANHGLYRRCANLNTPAACNWLVKVSGPVIGGQTLCLSCRLNRTIPDLSLPENAAFWGKIEAAKRRVVSALIALKLPVASRLSEDPRRGLAFDFLRSPPNGLPVLTGHENGIVTINVEEADDAKREQIRASMREPYRTLVGHFRHEVGHYYWDRLVAHTDWLPAFRRVFGDERTNYEAALQANYAHGPRLDWSNYFVSAYASIHPWEDWAETWAHYMHMVDTLGTAMSFGLKPDTIRMPFDCFGPDAIEQDHADDAERFLSFLNAWLKLSAVANELCRSMGQPDFYPFALPKSAVKKLHFVHRLVCDW